MNYETIDKFIADFQADHDKDRMTLEETYVWLEKMKLEAPTQQDLGKDVPYQND